MEAFNDREIQSFVACSRCKHPIAHKGIPTFYTVEIKQFAINEQAIRRRDANVRFMGTASGSAALGFNDSMAVQVPFNVRFAVCITCINDIMTEELFNGVV